MDIETVPVAFNMDLANGPTSLRFCQAACELLDRKYVEEENDGKQEWVSESVDYWSDELSSAGYCAIWNAGDVVVFDLRGLSDDERERFYRETENW